MATYYPCDVTTEAVAATSTLCKTCNTPQNPSDACTSRSSSNSSNNKNTDCDTYCNTSCNTKCIVSSSQTVCGTGHQLVSAHPDVGTFPGTTIDADDFIYEKWTIAFFSSLKNQITTAKGIGYQASMGETYTFTVPSAGDAVTATLYNNVEASLAEFVKDDGESQVANSYPTVQVNDLITASIANAIQTAYNAANFTTTVCDICNSSQRLIGDCACGCNCSCGCSCNCGCSCPCSNPCTKPT